jgi:hypothetical protein
VVQSAVPASPGTGDFVASPEAPARVHRTYRTNRTGRRVRLCGLCGFCGGVQGVDEEPRGGWPAAPGAGGVGVDAPQVAVLLQQGQGGVEVGGLGEPARHPTQHRLPHPAQQPRVYPWQPRPPHDLGTASQTDHDQLVAAPMPTGPDQPRSRSLAGVLVRLRQPSGCRSNVAWAHIRRT